MRKMKFNQKAGCKRAMVTLLSVAMTGSALSGCAEKDESILDPDNPVSLTIWHYYHGAQQNAFDALVTEFNNTVGKEEGIYVQGVGQGSVTDLETAVKDALAEKVGSDEMPDIFSSYADTAYEVEQAGALANLSDYLTDEELSVYVDSYIDEGRIASDDSLRIFPVAKSTEIMMINKTDWDLFATDTGASLDDLETIEGVVEVAKTYYEWTDAQTPDVDNDGKAFYGRDSMANYFSIGMKQLGCEIFQVENGEVTFNLDKTALKRLWDCYYVPTVEGYFGAYGSFRSDDVKTGDIIAYTGSTTSAMYFPDEVEKDGERYDIDYVVMPAPIFEGGENDVVQQGAGMVVTKSDEQHEYAAVEFLKWFTQAENNLAFCGDSGYLPVRKDANNKEILDKVIEEQELTLTDKCYDSIVCMFEEMEDATMYTSKNFKNGSAARNVLNTDMSDLATADRAEVEARLADGMSLEEACAPYVSDAHFEEWYEAFCQALEDSVK